MSIKRIIAIAILSSCTVFSTYAYEEVDCSTDSVFSANTCHQCFVESDEKTVGDNIGLLSDIWRNTSDMDKIIFKEEQDMPEMIALSSNATWSQTPSSEGFWEYTDEFNALYSEDEGGYILPATKEITWLKSKLGYAYKLATNTAAQSENIGLLVYPVAIHNILADGEITVDNEEHRECVLFKSAGGETPVTPTEETPPELPQTGPENYLLLIIIALILGYGIFAMRKRV